MGWDKSEGGQMNANVEGITLEATQASLSSRDGALAWYKVVGIEFVLFAGIVVPLICGALLAR
jgi:hypothetical protein